MRSERFISFPQCLDINTRLGHIDTLQGSDNILTRDGRMSKIAPQKGRDRLLNRIEQTWSFLTRQFLSGRVQNRLNNTLLHGKNVNLPTQRLHTRRINLTLNAVRDQITILFNGDAIEAVGKINIAPEMLPFLLLVASFTPPAFLLCHEVEKDATRTRLGQATMNTIGQFFKHAMHPLAQQILEMLQEKLATNQLDKLLLLLDNTAILTLNSPQGIKILRMDHLTKNASIKQATLINGCDLLRQTVNQPQQFLQPIVGKHIHNPEGVKTGTNAINTPGTLYHTRRVPVQIIV